MTWQPIDTAPRDGAHILVADLTPGSAGFGYCGPILPGTTWRSIQPWADVAHWFDDPDDPGFYASSYGADQDAPFQRITHWMPIPEAQP